MTRPCLAGAFCGCVTGRCATVDGLRAQLAAAIAERDEARADNSRLREALEWYAEHQGFSLDIDRGRRARHALAPTGSPFPWCACGPCIKARRSTPDADVTGQGGAA